MGWAVGGDGGGGAAKIKIRSNGRREASLSQRAIFLNHENDESWINENVKQQLSVLFVLIAA